MEICFFSNSFETQAYLWMCSFHLSNPPKLRKKPIPTSLIWPSSARFADCPCATFQHHFAPHTSGRRCAKRPDLRPSGNSVRFWRLSMVGREFSSRLTVGEVLKLTAKVQKFGLWQYSTREPLFPDKRAPSYFGGTADWQEGAGFWNGFFFSHLDGHLDGNMTSHRNHRAMAMLLK